MKSVKIYKMISNSSHIVCFLLKFGTGTEYDHVRLDLQQMFKVKGGPGHSVT